MCVLYRGLNRVTNLSKYPIGRCDSVIEDLGDASGELFIIYLDKTTNTNNKPPDLPIVSLPYGELAPSIEKHLNDNQYFFKISYLSIFLLLIIHCNPKN